MTRADFELISRRYIEEGEMESTHQYRVQAFGAGGRNGVIHAEGVLPAISFSPPPEFQGEVGRWTPEHLLVAAVASCFISTFEGMAQTSSLDFESLRDRKSVV